MKRFIKYIIVVIVLLAVTVTIFYSYWNRNQQINFITLLPATLEYCGQSITSSNLEYIELKSWLESHQFKWKNSAPVSYASVNIYSSENITITILSYAVVINYKTERGDWNQMIHQKEPHTFSKKCTTK